MTNSTNVEPVSYIYIIKPTGCQNNPGRVFPLDASASIPVLVTSSRVGSVVHHRLFHNPNFCLATPLFRMAASTPGLWALVHDT